MRTIDKRELSELIGVVYDSALSPTLWPAFLEGLSAQTGASAALLLMHDLARTQHTISAAWGFESAALRLYQERYGQLDVWAEKGHRKPTGHVCASESLVTVPELIGTQFYNDFIRPINIKHAMFGVVANEAGSLASMSVFRDPAAGPFAESQLHTLKLLVPHIQRAFGMHLRFAGVIGRAKGAEDAVNLLQCGVIFVDGNGAIILMNESANHFLISRDGLRVRAGKLYVKQPDELNRLEALIESATRTARGAGTGAGGTTWVSRKGKAGLRLTVAPLRSGILVGQPAAVVFISSPGERVDMPADFLRRHFKLTDAECRLTLQLIEGQSLTAVAASLQISLNTAKTQLKSIFSKTGARRQSDLVRLILSSADFIRIPE